MNITQINLVQRSLRQVTGDHRKEKIRIEEKITLLETLKNKSFEESQVLVAKALNIEIKSEPKICHQANESVRLEITLSKLQWDKIIEMRALLSHSLAIGSNWDQVLEYLADKVITQKRPKTKSVLQPDNNTSKNQTGEKIKKEFRHNSHDFFSENKNTNLSHAKLKTLVLERDKCCQFQDPKTKKICNSKWKLEVDHIQPRWDGGKNSLDNLRALCANHNQYNYRMQAGLKKTK